MIEKLRVLTIGGPQPVWLRYILLILGATGLLKLGLGTHWVRESAILYVLIPYLIGVAIYALTPHPEGGTFWRNFLRHMRIALIIMLSTSILLLEGFLCVLMFLPIYGLFAAIVSVVPKPKPPHNSLKASVVPLIILGLSLDGVGNIGSGRLTEVTRTALIDFSPDEIRANIINHQYPEMGRSKFLSLFPRPVSVEASSFEVGARHVAHMEYRRWGLSNLNVHRGTTVLEFIENTPSHLRAEFIHDDSYLSHYMRLRNWELTTEEIRPGKTEVTLTIRYERKLAPAWYFNPLQKRAVGDGLNYALTQILGNGS